MNWGITFLDELQRMKRKMDQTWSELFEGNPGYEQDVCQWIERLPKVEGTRGASKSRTNKMIKSF
jgi:hypothetical protein